MSRIGFLSLYATGHLNPAIALAKALQQRGHEIIFFNVLDREHIITERGLGFIPYGHSEYPVGALVNIFEKIGKLKGIEGFQYFQERMVIQANAVFRDLPQLISEHNIEALAIDQLFPGGATVAQHLRLPYASLAMALAANFDPGVPPPTSPLLYEDSPAAEARYMAAWQQLRQAFTVWREADNAQRVAWGLKPYDDVIEDSFSPLAQIANLPKVFDFPRKSLPSTFHYAGPMLHPEGREPIPFSWELLDERPLIYASMGTLQTGLAWAFSIILDACSGFDAQVVLSLGGSLGNDVLGLAELGEIPANAIVVPYAPQPKLLERSALCITHGGLNTTLECLTCGVPMVAIPVTNDQPAVAARIVYARAGEMMPLDKLTVETLRTAIGKVLGDRTYREHAQALQRAIKRQHPLIHACDVLEENLLAKIPTQKC